MEHLTEIKPNTYVVNLQTFEESELAKRKKKRTQATQAPKGTEERKATKATKANDKPEVKEVPKAKQETQASEVTKAAEVAETIEVTEAVKAAETAQVTEPAQVAEPAEMTEAAEAPSAPVIVDNAVTIKQVKVSYDEDTRLYTVECKDEFYDDSPDLDRITRVVKQLVPDAAEKELNLLRDL